MDVNRVRARIGELRGEFEDRLAALVEVPTVSMDPGRRGEIDRCAGSRRSTCARSARVSTSSTPAGSRWSWGACSAIRRGRR